jgi:hypothetical protein
MGQYLQERQSSKEYGLNSNLLNNHRQVFYDYSKDFIKTKGVVTTYLQKFFLFAGEDG